MTGITSKTFFIFYFLHSTLDMINSIKYTTSILVSKPIQPSHNFKTFKTVEYHLFEQKRWRLRALPNYRTRTSGFRTRHCRINGMVDIWDIKMLNYIRGASIDPNHMFSMDDKWSKPLIPKNWNLEKGL